MVLLDPGTLLWACPNRAIHQIRHLTAISKAECNLNIPQIQVSVRFVNSDLLCVI